MLMRDFTRLLEKEKFIDYYADSIRTSAPTGGWVTKYSKQFTVDEDGQVLLWSFRYVIYSSGSSASWDGVRALVDSRIVYQILQYVPASYANEGDQTPIGMIKLSAGTHTFSIQVRIDTAIYYLDIMNIKLGLFKLEDQAGIDATATQTVTAGATATVLSTSLTKLAKRRIPLGKTSKTNAKIFTTVESSGNVVILKNPGEANEANKLNARLYIDGVEVGWDILHNYANKTPQSVWGERQSLILDLADVQGGYTVEVKVYNGYSADKSVTVHLQAYASPWLMPLESNPMVELDVPFGSTIYIVSEPLFADPTKEFRLGFTKAWSTVFNLDNYYVVSGTGILQFSYTFDLYPSQIPQFLKWKGDGATISFLVADIR